MTVKKQKPLLELEVPAMQLPPLSIEEPSERPMPTPVPVIIPGMTVMGGSTYYTQTERSLPIKIVPSVLVSVEAQRVAESGIGIDYEVTSLGLHAEKELGFKSDYDIHVIIVDSTKYDGKSNSDILAIGGCKYDGKSNSSVAA